MTTRGRERSEVFSVDSTTVLFLVSQTLISVTSVCEQVRKKYNMFLTFVVWWLTWLPSCCTAYSCDDGCIISDTYFEDGEHCDCSNCEDESSWTCLSCADCPSDCGSQVNCSYTSHSITIYTSAGDLAMVSRTSIYVYQGTSGSNPTNIYSYPIFTDTNPIHTIIANDNNLGPCYTIYLEALNGDHASIPFERSSFGVLFDGFWMSLPNQTHTFDHNLETDTFSINMYWCSILFASLTPSDTTGNTERRLSISFESYPSNLVLQIYINTLIFYKNNFGETTATTTSATSRTTGISNSNSNYDYNYNYSIVFPNIISTCFNISIIDHNYQDIDLDSSLNHVRYIITLNNKTVKYGGYYSRYEITTVCTFDTSFCITPNECNNVTMDKSETIVQGWSYKSYYGSILSNVDDSGLNLYGASSFENGSIVSGVFEYHFQEWLCNGVQSCYNAHFDSITYFITLNTYCQGWSACSRLNITRQVNQYHVDYGSIAFHWYVFVCLFNCLNFLFVLYLLDDRLNFCLCLWFYCFTFIYCI